MNTEHPLPLRERPMPVPVQPAATVVPRAGPIVMPPVRLLDSVAAFTHHRDIDALDHSLALSLAELSGAQTVALCKRPPDSEQVQAMVRCTLQPDGGYAVVACALAADDTRQQALGACMETQCSLADVTASGRHRLFVPIVHEGRALGALKLEALAPLEPAQPLAEGFARIYANYITLLQESERDKLTGLYNRRSFERHLQRLFHRPVREVVATERRAPQPARPDAVWLAMLDIDHFKRINDTFGHVYGDEVILLLAQQMRASFRQGDVLFRFGGEEFVVLLADAGEADVHALLERFRRRLAGHVFPQVGQVTVSVGYARAGRHDYPESVVDRADKALYFAKEHGRNRTCGYEALVGQGLLGQAAVGGSVDLF